jgi:hypothetical protein
LGPVVAACVDHVVAIPVCGLAARTANGTAQKLRLLVAGSEALTPPARAFRTRRWGTIDRRLRLPGAVLRLARLLVLPIVLGLAIMPLVALVPIPGASLVVAPMLTMLRPSIVAALLILKARLVVLMAGRWLLALADIVGLVVGTIVPVAALGPNPWTASAVHLAGLLHLLLAVRQDDPVVMFCMLQIILGQHRIARRLSISRQREVFLRDMRRRTPDFHFWSIGLEASRQGIVTLSMIIIMAIVLIVIVIAAATAAAMLLSLPHGLPFSR